jgi:hypothetical protein
MRRAHTVRTRATCLVAASELRECVRLSAVCVRVSRCLGGRLRRRHGPMLLIREGFTKVRDRFATGSQGFAPDITQFRDASVRCHVTRAHAAAEPEAREGDRETTHT